MEKTPQETFNSWRSEAVEATTQSEMVERVARAIFMADGAKFHVDPAYSWGSAEIRTPFLAAARAAIAAMREPTRAMKTAGLDVSDWLEGADPIEAYQCMIDAALAEGDAK